MKTKILISSIIKKVILTQFIIEFVSWLAATCFLVSSSELLSAIRVSLKGSSWLEATFIIFILVQKFITLKC